MNKNDQKQNQNQKDLAKNINIAPGVANDQLGENADMEFAEDYANKGNDITKSTKKTTKQ